MAIQHQHNEFSDTKRRGRLGMSAEKSEEQVAKEREAVEAMRNAKANMTSALERVETLERALRAAADAMVRFKGYVPAHAYAYPVNGKTVTCHSEIDAAVNAARAKF